MSDFGQELAFEVTKSFVKNIKSDKTLKKLTKKAMNSADYEKANEYAVRIGELASNAVQSNTETLSFMSKEVAREVLTPLLSETHQIVSSVAQNVQKNLNASNDLGIEALSADLDTNRIDGFIEKVASYENFEDAKWVLKEPIVNYSQAIVDQTIRKNARADSKMGLTAKITRTTESRPCKWCASLAGTYLYEDVSDTGNDVFRRHENCRCRVTFKYGKNKQDVWSKASWTGNDSDTQRKAILQKQREIEVSEERKMQERLTRKNAIEEIQRALGYSPKGAAIFYNANKKGIEQNGLDYYIEARLSQS